MDKLIESYVKVNSKNMNMSQDLSKSNIFDLNFPLSKLLSKHSIFKKSDNLMPKINILNQYFSSGHQQLISFSLINNKIYQSYVDAIKKMDPVIQTSLKFREARKDFRNEQQNIDLNEMLREILKVMKQYESLIEFLLNEIPGFNTLPIEYQAKIIKNNIINIFLITYVNYYENGELIFYLENGYHVTKKSLAKLRGQYICDLQYNFLDCLHDLKITEREKSILLAYLFSIPGKL